MNERAIPADHEPGAQSSELISFVLVGTLALVLHFAAVNLLVPLGTDPLLANVMSFFLALGFSIEGHRRWSFPKSRRSRSRAVRRFVVVATLGFVSNEILYWLLLAWTPLDFGTALLIVLWLVACFTFLASKFWAFDHCGS